jgi:hypothetical protein
VINIVAETLEGNVEAYEMKRNPQKYSPARLEENSCADAVFGSWKAFLTE